MKKVIVFDIDGTLIDLNYKITQDVNLIKKSIKEAQDQGHIVSLSSGTPLPSIKKWADLFGIEGMSFCEKGAFVFQDNEIKFINKELDNLIFQKVKHKIIDYLIDSSMVQSGEMQLIIGDVNKNANGLLTNIIELDNGIKSVVLINGMRMASLSMFVFSRDTNGMWVKDYTLMQDMIDLAAQFFSKDFSLEIDFNKEVGIIIWEHKNVSKKNTLHYIKEKYPDATVYMVGNSLPDYLDDPSVIQCGVANSDSDYKDKCSIVSDSNFTEGSLEILQKIINS